MDDFDEVAFSLIGIHTALEDYKLAYILNKTAAVFLQRTEDLDVIRKKKQSCFASFKYQQKKEDQTWYLIKNSVVLETVPNGIFDASEVIDHLIPEKKKIDYFLKLEGEFSTKQVEEITKKINVIPQIITSYSIETNKLKSKNNFII